MTQIQSNKQDIGKMQKKLKLNINEYRNSEVTPNTIRITSRWSNDEVMLAIQGKIYKTFVIFFYLCTAVHFCCIFNY